MNQSNIKNKTKLDYWDEKWQKRQFPDPIDPAKRSLINQCNIKIHNFLKLHLQNNTRPKCHLLEIGCAGSPWLPYFAKHFNFEVWGMDYSKTGCEQAEEVLHRAGLKGHIINADLFPPPANLVAFFDIIFSFGVVEHFDPVSDALLACAKYLKEDGLMITFVPNLLGIYGPLQKRLDRRIYDLHSIIDAKQFLDCHFKAGLQPICCEYLCFISLGLLNYDRIQKEFPRIWPVIWRVRAAVDRICWLGERLFPSIFRPNPLTSPYIACLSRKKIS